MTTERQILGYLGKVGLPRLITIVTDTTGERCSKTCPPMLYENTAGRGHCLRFGAVEGKRPKRAAACLRAEQEAIAWKAGGET
jgi:hypothetical protein